MNSNDAFDRFHQHVPTISRRSALGLGVFAAIGASALAGCGSSSAGGTTGTAGGTPAASESAVTVSKPVKGKLNVSWWSHNNPSFVAANIEMIKRFQAVHRDVNIVYQYFPYDVLANKLQAAYRAKNVADIQQMFGSWVPEYSANGLLAEVPASIGGSGVANKFWAPATGSYQHNGKLFGIPHEYNLENGGLLYNPKLAKAAGITAPPTTWGAMVEAGQKMTKLDAKGRASQVGLAFTGTDSITFTFMSMILEQGASFWNSDRTHVDFSTPAAQKAWIDETNLVTKDRVDNTTWYQGDPYELFFKGKAGMAKQGPWVIEAGRASFPKFHDLRYIPEPPYAGDTVRFAAESGWGEVVNAGAPSENQDAAWKFIDFMAQADNAREWNAKTATIPGLKELKNDAELLKSAPYLEVPFAVLANGEYVGHIPDRDKFWGYMQDAFVSVELKKAEPLAALSAVEKKINDMFDQAGGPS